MVTLPPCPLCEFGDWPEGGMHAARSIHIHDHLRRRNVVYGCCVGWWDKFHRYVTPSYFDRRRQIIALSGQPSIAVAYNKILDACKGQKVDALILVHDDLSIVDLEDAETKFLAALIDPDVALVGVAGGKSAHSLHWWNSEKVGHQMTNSGLLDFGPRTGDVAFIEGSVMVFSPWAIENLRIDERYEGFSAGWDDVCIHALEQNKRVTVVDVDTHHHTTVGWKSSEAKAKFDAAEEQFRVKWRIV